MPGISTSVHRGIAADFPIKASLKLAVASLTAPTANFELSTTMSDTSGMMRMIRKLLNILSTSTLVEMLRVIICLG